MLVASTSVVGFGFRSGKLERVNVFRFAPESGQTADMLACPLRANSGHMPPCCTAPSVYAIWGLLGL